MGVAAHDRLGPAAQLGRQLVAVDQHDVGPLGQRLQRAAHGEERGLQDVDPVDLLDRGLGHGELHQARGGHRLVGLLAILERQLLGIVDQLQEFALGRRAVDHRHRRDHRPGQGSASGFVDAGNASFQAQFIAKARHIPRHHG